MRKLLLTLGVCVVAVVLAPVASAGAATFAGTCKIEGTATIYKAGGFVTEEALPATTQEKRNYKFVSSGGECEGSPKGAKFNRAEVKGEGNLSCIKSESITGSGFIEISSKEQIITSFKFTGAGTEVQFEAEGPFVTGLGGKGPATGQASFAEDKKAVEQCPKGEAKKLEFKAATVGEFG